MAERFTSQQVIQAIGITARQLQWWDERGVVKPDREGHRRLYSMNQLSEVAVICQLRREQGRRIFQQAEAYFVCLIAWRVFIGPGCAAAAQFAMG